MFYEFTTSNGYKLLANIDNIFSVTRSPKGIVEVIFRDYTSEKVVPSDYDFFIEFLLQSNKFQKNV